MSRKSLLLIGLLAATVQASPEPPRLEEVSILGDPSQVMTIPGSAHQLDAEFLARFEQADIMRVLRSVPGVYLQEEDGAGLRPNIGIRGSGIDRSSRIALLEDGVLIAPAPYAAPSAYYFPTQRRMSSVEVLKGPSAVRLGPRTIGGAMNMLSTPIPDSRVAAAEVFVGEDGFGETHAWYGDSRDHVAWLFETVQQRSDGFKQLDNGGDTGFDIRDYLGKLRFTNAPDAAVRQGLEFKVGYTRQVSDETYLGLTDADFDQHPYRRYAGSALDQMRNTHNQHQVTYFAEPADEPWRFELTAYNNEFTRNWFKVDSVSGTGIGAVLANPEQYSAELAVLRGEADSADGALTLRNNNRSYYSRGIQMSLSSSLSHGDISHEIKTGIRLHRDQVDRFQHDDRYDMQSGRLVIDALGAPGSQANRVSEADVAAVYIEDQVDFGRLEITPGLRYERIEMARYDYSTADPTREQGPTRVRENELDVVIPGVGASYQLDNGVVLLAGIHRGFNPPAPGSTAAEEDSTNIELGARFDGGRLSAEAIGFYNDYGNLVGTCTASTGGSCEIGDQFDGGAATISGIEALLRWQVAAPQSRLAIPLRLTYTYTAEAEFETSFNSSFDPWGDVISGDQLPYVPEHQLQFAADLVATRWSTGLNLNYVGDTRAVAGQGSIPANELIDSYWVLDWSGRMRLNDRFELFARIDNLLDETYAVSRRPAGLRPGKPRTAIIGFIGSL